MPPYENLWTVVVAGGSGRRFGAPKQFASLSAAERVIDRSIAVARSVSAGVVVVLPGDDLAEVSAEPEGSPPLLVVAGGDSRAASVRAGLAAVPSAAEVICVHDGARPFADADLYRRVVAALDDPAVSAAVPGVAVTDTIKQVVREGTKAQVVTTPDRSSLVAVQTPQAFRAETLRAAHDRFGGDDEMTDDAMMIERLGRVVAVVEGEVTNRKITLIEDLEWARAQIAKVPG
jgi:2-C-methyl-D-erythritol 4-phosphate cytidylyltransferase